MQNRFTLSEQALEYMPILERTNKIETWFNSDEEFNRLYPVVMQLLAHKHWTPLNIAKKAANFLAAEPHKKILDIGSGVGKFCLSAAYYKPNSFYYGVEQRENLIAFSEAAKNSLEIVNVSFIYGNFTQLNVGGYALKDYFMAGLWYRQTDPNSDALIMMVGIKKDGLRIAYSYDLTVSDARAAAAGSHEISLIIESKKYNPSQKRHWRKINCPDNFGGK